jgi:hypothetical protein
MSAISVHTGPSAASNRSRVPPNQSLDPSHPQIKGDILRMIAQYLHNERYASTAMRRHSLPNMLIFCIAQVPCMLQ